MGYTFKYRIRVYRILQVPRQKYNKAGQKKEQTNLLVTEFLRGRRGQERKRDPPRTVYS